MNRELTGLHHLQISLLSHIRDYQRKTESAENVLASLCIPECFRRDQVARAKLNLAFNVIQRDGEFIVE